MGHEVRLKTKQYLTASDVAKFLGVEIYGDNVQINVIRSLDNICEQAITFSKGKVERRLLKNVAHVCFITSELPDSIGSNAFVIVENPRLAFAKTLSEFFVEKKTSGVGKYSVIHPTAKIADSVIIGNGCTIGQNVVIRGDTEIRNNVVIADGVRIGAGCLIRSNSVIGEEGFGFEFDENGTPIRIPHMGSVEIGDSVEIGNFTTISKGTLTNTIIHSHVKIDNLVHIAHNCVLGEKSMIIACAEVSGSVVVGKKCWLGPNCSIMNKIKIGDNSLIGLGAVVIENVLTGAVMAGNPAKIIRMQGKV